MPIIIICFGHIYFYPFSQDQKHTSKSYQLHYHESLFDIINLEWYCVIVGNSGTLFQKVSNLCCKYYDYSQIHLTGFIPNNYFWVSVLEYIPSTKNKKQHCRGTIWNTGYEH